jgi:hypothetical protein
VIIGGESGPNARPCQLEWIAHIVAQCMEFEVPVFVKQIGSNPMLGQKPYVPLSGKLSPKGNDPHEWPEALRVREWPDV